MTTKINLNELKEFVDEKKASEIMYSYSDGIKLTFSLNGFFYVYDGKDRILKTQFANVAVDKVNELLELSE